MGIEEARRILGKEKIIGATAKTVEQAKAAMEQGADYLGSGAVFGSSTKKDAVTMSFDMLKIYAGVLQFPLWQSEELTFQMFQNLQKQE